MKVLVVEDDHLLLALMNEVFAGAGHDTDCAHSAAEARQRLMASNYDVVVLDLHLGDDTGLSVATLSTYCNPQCRVIVVTGSGMFAKGEIFEVSPSISKILRKPVAIDELLAVSEHAASMH